MNETNVVRIYISYYQPIVRHAAILSTFIVLSMWWYIYVRLYSVRFYLTCYCLETKWNAHIPHVTKHCRYMYVCSYTA